MNSTARLTSHHTSSRFLPNSFAYHPHSPRAPHAAPPQGPEGAPLAPLSAPRKGPLRSVPHVDVPETATPRPSDSRQPNHSALATYLQQLRKHALLSREEEHKIAVEYAATGDRRLANQLITANLRLVVKIALEYRTAHRNLLDLVQEGNVGLIHAVEKYDPHRGFKLSTYASWWIRAYVLKFILSNARLVKIGTTQAQRRLFFGLRKARAELERCGSPAVEAKHLAVAMDVREQDVIDMERRMAASEASLDAPSKHHMYGDRTCGDSLSAEDRLRPDVQSEDGEFQAAVKVQLKLFTSGLAGRDLEIFRSRFVNEDASTLAQLAEQFGVSRERVRQIEVRLKKRLRRHLEASLGDALTA
jgi:RNA polymerase sigma-32 factor